MMKFNDIPVSRINAMYHAFMSGIVSREIESKFGHLKSENGLTPDWVKTNEEYIELNKKYKVRNGLEKEVNRVVGKDPEYKKSRKLFDKGEHIRLLSIEKRLIEVYHCNPNDNATLVNYEVFCEFAKSLINGNIFRN